MNVLDAIRNRRSVRDYSPQAIPDDVMDRMREAMRLAPSACNLQPWHFVMVTSEVTRRKLGAAAHGQLWIATAPVIVVACGRPQQAYPRMGGSGNSVDIDVTIALDHLMLAAVAEGLGTCWIGSFSEREVKRLLDVPRGVKVVALTPLGFPASADLICPVPEAARKPAAEVFSQDKFSQPLS